MLTKNDLDYIRELDSKNFEPINGYSPIACPLRGYCNHLGDKLMELMSHYPDVYEEYKNNGLYKHMREFREAVFTVACAVAPEVSTGKPVTPADTMKALNIIKNSKKTLAHIDSFLSGCLDASLASEQHKLEELPYEQRMARQTDNIVEVEKRISIVDKSKNSNVESLTNHLEDFRVVESFVNHLNAKYYQIGKGKNK